MALFFENWDNSFVTSLLSDSVGWLVIGIFLAACVWVVGYSVIKLFDMLKGGF